MNGSRRVTPGITLDEPVGAFSKVEITGHARERMALRGVTQAQILDTLRAPQTTGLPTQPGRKRVRRSLSPRMTLDVVYEERTDRLRVITTFKRPRWRGRRR